MNFFQSRIFEIPRKWSNKELRKYAHLFDGDVVNVSAWKDEDKEGSCYKDYFKNANSYTITNYKAESRGWQGYESEVFLNLEEDLPKELQSKFDVVFNHTTLEHIYEVHKAFKNLCAMSRDIVILVVPFLQQMHADYGDYWRFTPLTIKRLFEKNDMTVVYSSFNEHDLASIYLFCIASKKPRDWYDRIGNNFTFHTKKRRSFLNLSEPYVGNRSIKDNVVVSMVRYLRMYYGRLRLTNNNVEKV